MSVKITKTNTTKCDLNSPTSSIVKAVPQNCLEKIFKSSESKYHPNNSFGLSLPYQNCSPNPLNPLKYVKGSLGSPRLLGPTHTWEGSPCASPLSKSTSMPTIYALGSMCGDEDDAAVSQDSCTIGEWSCKHCKTSDISNLEGGGDSSLVCACCGTVEQSVTMVSQERSKNCAKRDDSTQVAEARFGSAKEAAYNAWSNGPESSEDRRARMQSWANGTRMSTKTLKKHDLISGQNILDLDAVRNAQNAVEANPKEHNRQTAIIRILEMIFDILPSLDDRIKKHIRRESVRIYSASMQHEAICKEKGCMLALSTRSNSVIAYSMTEWVLEMLCTPHLAKRTLAGQEMKTIASIAPECTVQDIRIQLFSVKQLQMRYAGAVHRMQVMGAINIIGGWENGDTVKPCPEPAPPLLRLPPAIANFPDKYGRAPLPDPSDVTMKLRERVHSTAQLTRTRGDVRNSAMESLSVAGNVNFLKESSLNQDVLACSLLRATATKMNLPDSTELLKDHILHNACVSQTTYSEFTAELGSILQFKQLAEDTEELF